MSLGPAEISDLVALGAPVLCVDTCTVLDVIRDITRETVRLSDTSAGFALLAAAETNADLVVLMAAQVAIELASNLPEVQQEAEVVDDNYLGRLTTTMLAGQRPIPGGSGRRGYR